MTDKLYVDPHHKVPDDEWGDVVRRAQAIHEETLAHKTGGAASPAGPVIDFRGRSNKHSGVSGMPTQLLVLHSAECPLRGGYAQSLTEWAITSAVIASWQRFIDPIARVYMIDDQYAAWHASEANPMSIGWEQAGYARYTYAEWTTPDGMLQMESLAYDMAQVALRDGIPPVWLTTEQVTAITTYGDRTTKGFCCHRQIDPESRTDPGDGYPYDLLMQKIRSYMGQGITAQSATLTTDPQGFLMALSDQDQDNIYKAISRIDQWLTGGGPKAAVEAALNDPAVLDRIALAVLKRECYSVDPATGQTNGTTTLARKINWMAHNDQAILSAIVDVSKKLDVAHPVLPAEASVKEEVAE